MTKKDILNQVTNSKWQPEFEFTDNINDAVDSILKPHEDYGLGLHSELIKILEEEEELASDGQDLLINISWILDVQKRLYNHKLSLLTEEWYWLPNTNLHNETGGLGLRNRAVQVGSWIPPGHYLIPILLDMCLPIMINWDSSLTFSMDYYAQTSLSEIASFHSVDTVKYDNNDSMWSGGYGWYQELQDKYEADILKGLTQWYKVFETIHPLNDLNGRVGGLIINIVSHNLTGKYLINKEYYK
jgi:hypothetical protein